ncbi:helix-turn-helix domain-containing protein [Candidatus Dojkabacteria bacterium]|nr:helix-turn-helix domain-containing protein [Candidatus Dojkabacteria bacterium]
MKGNEIGGVIRFYRKKKGLTQQELAEKVGVSWEMISRYERGSSSAINSIPEIAKALDISTYRLLYTSDQLRDSPTTEYSNNQIPLFVKIPKSEVFSHENTRFYYTAPQWIRNQDSHAFAIDTELVDVNTLQVKKRGILFVSPKQKPSGQDITLYWHGSELEVDTLTNTVSDDKIIGKVLAQEVRFAESTED